jgi:hypothetical protein
MLRRTTLLAVLGLVAVTACNGDDSGNPAVDANPLSCACEPPLASEVVFDNTTSGLAATDGQAALDELAARTAPANDVAMRVTRVEAKVMTSTIDQVVHVAACPDGALALGGACSGAIPNGSLAGTSLRETSFMCTWNNPDIVSGIEVTATVTCLAPLGAP